MNAQRNVPPAIAALVIVLVIVAIGAGWLLSNASERRARGAISQVLYASSGARRAARLSGASGPSLDQKAFGTKLAAIDASRCPAGFRQAWQRYVSALQATGDAEGGASSPAKRSPAPKAANVSQLWEAVQAEAAKYDVR